MIHVWLAFATLSTKCWLGFLLTVGGKSFAIADDLLLVGTIWDNDIDMFARILKEYYLAAGQRVNQKKSVIHANSSVLTLRDYSNSSILSLSYLD